MNDARRHAPTLAPSRPVLLVAADAPGCARLKALLEQQPELDPRCVATGTSRIDGATLPSAELAVLDLSERGADMLQQWTGRPNSSPLPLIVIGPATDLQLMRTAMQAGARDYLAHPASREQLLESLHRILRESPADGGRSDAGGRLTAVINAKGGSGSSFIASNLAHILVAHLNQTTALIDMDLQFGALPLALDLNTRDTLFEAIGAADHLDPMALKGHMTRHKSGLHVLGAMSDRLVMPNDVAIDAVHKLLAVSLQAYAHTVVDLPRQIDALTTAVLVNADRVLVVTQQSFAHLRDTKRMFGLLQAYVGVPGDRISLVINRYQERHSISADDFRDAIKPNELLTVPNDFAHVSSALNLGVPVYEGSRNAGVTKALCTIAESLALEPAAEVAAAPARPARHMLRRVLGLGA